MTESISVTNQQNPFISGIKDAIPLMGGYIPVAISFGLISLQAGFSIWATVLISVFVYAGASQFLFVAMVASGAPLWLVVIMTLLINARHVVYGPNLSPYVSKSPWWIVLMHGLTDQIFALAHTRFPDLKPNDRMGWYMGAALVAWFSWIGGTALGVIGGAELMMKWPLLGEVLPFALPALFLVLLAPKFESLQWTITILGAALMALTIKLLGYTNAAIPMAALCGAVLYYTVRHKAQLKEKVRG